MTMMNSKVRKSYRNETTQSQEVKAAAGEKYTKSFARNAGKLAAYKAGYEHGKSGLSFSDALWAYEKTLPVKMTSKENEAFVSGQWDGSHGNAPEF